MKQFKTKPTGRPPKHIFDPKCIEVAYRLAHAGKMERAIARKLCIPGYTLQAWKTRYPAFGMAIEVGKEIAVREGRRNPVDPDGRMWVVRAALRASRW